MMTTEKIERLSKNLSALIGESEIDPSVSDIYYKMSYLRKRYSEYFTKTSFQDFIKLVFYTYSYILTGNFKLAQKYLNNIFFVGFFLASDEKYESECPDCDGTGRYDCPYCDDGSISCNECDGTGNVTDEDGEEGDMVTCDNCEGDGTVSCSNCYGSGRDDCNRCQSSGVVETDENYYRVETYLSWNPKLKSVAESNYNSTKSIGDEDEFTRLTQENSFLISSEDTNGTLESFVNPNEHYVYYFSDEGDELVFSSSGNLLNSDEPTSYLN